MKKKPRQPAPRQITDDELDAIVAKINAMNFDDPKNHLSDEELADGTQDTTAEESGRIITISYK